MAAEGNEEEGKMPEPKDPKFDRVAHLEYCQIKTLNANPHRGIEIEGVGQPPDFIVLVMVDDFPPFILENNIECVGMVRVHLVTPGDPQEIYYRDLH
jgi:hypothetical protein